jgi:hypothetical protein
MPKSLASLLSEVRRAIPVGDRDAQANATAPITDHVDLTDYRPITPQEKALLTAMLHSTTPPATAFLPQLEGMLVKSGCTCGCPSIDFAPPPDETRIAFPHQNIVSDMFGYTTEGPHNDAEHLVGLILWQAGGKLTSLEVYDFADRGLSEPYPLPILETLHAANFNQPGTPDSESPQREPEPSPISSNRATAISAKGATKS